MTAEAAGSEPRARILVVDDDPGLRRLLGLRLEAGGYLVDSAASGEEALGRLAARLPDLLITDLRMDGLDGMALFDRVRRGHPTLPVIILTAHGTIPEAVEATRRGAFGFLSKPFESDALLAEVARALEVSGSGSGATPDEPWRADFLTRSRVMEGLLSEARLVARSEASVLIQGESGTGKEVMARAIHRASPRASGVFVAVNCAAIPADLLESELFGHEKGAFTGASVRRDGLMLQATGGTLFLDEIGDMPLAFQAKLLRALQERSIRPVGANIERAVDVRVISATHRDLDVAMGEGAFREDLYYRLNVVRLEIPPLRKRPEDIPLLAEHFLREVARAESAPSGFTPEAMRLLVQAPWPGNVRQLRNLVEQVCALSPGGAVSEDLVTRALREDKGEFLRLAEARAEFERDYLAGLLRLTGGNVSEAARLAGRNRTEFYRLLDRHHLTAADFK
jgi:two-component system, NtrC family, response regulator GlrR